MGGKGSGKVGDEARARMRARYDKGESFTEIARKYNESHPWEFDKYAISRMTGQLKGKTKK